MDGQEGVNDLHGWTSEHERQRLEKERDQEGNHESNRWLEKKFQEGE